MTDIAALVESNPGETRVMEPVASSSLDETQTIDVVVAPTGSAEANGADVTCMIDLAAAGAAVEAASAGKRSDLDKTQVLEPVGDDAPVRGAHAPRGVLHISADKKATDWEPEIEEEAPVPLAPHERDFGGFDIVAVDASGFTDVKMHAVAPAPVTAVIDDVSAFEGGSEASFQTPGASADSEEEKPESRPKKSKKGLVIALIIIVLAIAGAIGGYLWYVNDLNAKAHTLHAVPLTIEAEGYDDNATNIPVKVTGTDLDGNDASGMYYVNAAGEGIELLRGDYEISFPASPIGSDGSLWTAPDTVITLSIGDDIEPNATYEGVKDQTVTFAPLAPLDITVENINLAYEYAKNDPAHGNDAATYRDKVIEAREQAIADAEAEAEAQRIAEEEEALREAAEEARKNASEDGYYVFAYAPSVTTTTQDDFEYWHIEARAKGEIRRYESLDDLSGDDYDKCSSVVFLLPESDITCQSSGGTAGIIDIDSDVGRAKFLECLEANSAQGLQIILHVVDAEVTFIRFCS